MSCSEAKKGSELEHICNYKGEYFEFKTDRNLYYDKEYKYERMRPGLITVTVVLSVACFFAVVRYLYDYFK